MEQVIIPDMSATKTITINAMNAEYGLYIGEAMMTAAKTEEEKTDASNHIKTARKMLDEDNGEGPAIIIGYMKPSVKRRIARAEYAAYSASDPDLDVIDDLARDWIKFGVKGHVEMAGVEYQAETVKIRGRDIEVASEDMIDLYEEIGVLHSLAYVVKAFNTLGKKKETRSPRTSGKETVTLTAPHVETTITQGA